MNNNVITKVYLKRALLFICGKGKSGDIHFLSEKGEMNFTPLYKSDENCSFTACFDLASGYKKSRSQMENGVLFLMVKLILNLLIIVILATMAVCLKLLLNATAMKLFYQVRFPLQRRVLL